MNEKILQQLREYSDSLFSSLKIELSDVAKPDFDTLLENAVNRMEREDRMSDRDVNEAKQAFYTLIQRTYPRREERSGQKGLVRFQALNESKSSICPLWPIC